MKNKRVKDLERRVALLENSTNSLERRANAKDYEVLCPQCGSGTNHGWYGKRYCGQGHGICGHFVISSKAKRGRAHSQASSRFFKTCLRGHGQEVDHPEDTGNRELVLHVVPGQDPLIVYRDGDLLNKVFRWESGG